MDTDSAPPYYAITSDNHAAWVVAASIIFLLYNIGAVATKITLRINLTSIKLPDLCLIGSLVVLVLQTAFIIRACNQGLGQHAATLDNAAFEEYSKYFYAASILAIAIQAVTKLSICLLITSISPQRALGLANKALMAIIVAWAVSGILAVAFACGLPDPWRTDDKGICYSRKKINIYNGVMNILTDLAICVLPVAMMWNVQTSITRKAQVCALFGSRILVPVIIIPALATSGGYFDNLLTDPTWYAVVPTVFSQISLNLSVLTACIPGLKSVLDNLLSGTANARVDGPYNLTASGDKNTPLTATPTFASRSGSGSGTRTRGFASKVAQKFRPSDTQHTLSIRGGGNETEMTRQKSNSSPGRTESTRKLTDGFILRTDHYEVTSVQRNNSTSQPDYGSRTSGDDDEIAHSHSR